MIFMNIEKIYALYPKADFRGELVGIYLVQDNLEPVRSWGWINYSILRQCLLVDCTDLSIYLLINSQPDKDGKENARLKKKKNPGFLYGFKATKFSHWAPVREGTLILRNCLIPCNCFW